MHYSPHYTFTLWIQLNSITNLPISLEVVQYSNIPIKYIHCHGNLLLCLLVGYGEDRLRKKHEIYCTSEKRNYLQCTTVSGWPDVKRSTSLYFCMMVSGLNKVGPTVFGAVMIDRLIQVILWNLCSCWPWLRWPFKGEDISIGFMGRFQRKMTIY